jgi:hypothetical protein
LKQEKLLPRRIETATLNCDRKATMSVSSLELLQSSDAVDSRRVTTPDLSSNFEAATSHELRCINRDGRRSVGLTELGRTWLERFHSAPELVFSTAKTWLKQDTARRAALVEAEIDGQRMTWFLKETVTRRFWVRFVVRFGDFRSSNAWKQGLAFRALSISTPRPLALSTFTRNGAYYEYLLTEVVSGAVTLNQWLGRKALISDHGLDLNRRGIARELGTQLRKMHQHGFDHRDLKGSNILVSEFDAGLKLWLIDLDGVWRWPVLPPSRRIQNLARLWVGMIQFQSVSATDALRFLKVYLGPDWRCCWKALWCKIIRRAAIKLRDQVVGNLIFC